MISVVLTIYLPVHRRQCVPPSGCSSSEVWADVISRSGSLLTPSLCSLVHDLCFCHFTKNSLSHTHTYLHTHTLVYGQKNVRHVLRGFFHAGLKGDPLFRK